MRFLLFIFMFGSSVTYGKSYNVLYPLSEDEVISASSMASVKGEGLRMLSGYSESLFDAVSSSNLRKAKELLNKGADLNVVDKLGRSPIHYVTDVRMLKVLLAAGADPNAVDRYGFTALHLATDAKVIEALVVAGAELGARAFNGDTPLQYAEKQKNLKKIKALEVAEADLDAKSVNDKTSLQNGGNQSNSKKEKIRLTGGGHLNVEASPAEAIKSGDTPFDSIVTDAKITKVPSVSKKRATDVNARDAAGYTALHNAAKENDLKRVKALLARGANPKAETNAGYTALHYAIGVGVAKALLAAGARLDAKSITGQTPLHLSMIVKNNPELIQFLLAAGADPNAKTKDGKTPAFYEHIEKQDMEKILNRPLPCKSAFNR